MYDKVYQLHFVLVQGRWFSPDTLASHTIKTGHDDIAENCCTDIKPYETNKQLDSVFQEILLVCQQIRCTM